MLTLADKGGRGVGEMMKMADKGGRGGLDPPFLGGIIHEQPLKNKQFLIVSCSNCSVTAALLTINVQKSQIQKGPRKYVNKNTNFAVTNFS